jgi:tetratricopeptide (TPR) repeat protein
MANGAGGSFAEAEICYRQGKDYQQQNLLAKALECFENATRLNPAHAPAYFGKGLVLARLGRWLDASLAYKESIHLDPENAEAHLNLGFVYYELGYDQEARNAFQTAQRYNPALHTPF